MNEQLKQMAMAVASLISATALAVDYIWTSDAASGQEWHTLANWSVGGAAATDLPTNVTDRAIFPSMGTSMKTVDLMPKADGRAASIAAVVGGANWRLNLNAAGDKNNRDYTETFEVASVNDFAGEWSATGGKKTLRLTAEEGVQTLAVAATEGQFSVDVAREGVTADIQNLMGMSGSLKKSGAGGLRVGSVVEPGNLVLEVEEGDVQIDGKAVVADDAAVLAKAAAHFDASVRETWEPFTYVEDGRTCVSNWLDRSGRAISASVWDNSKDGTDSHIKDIHPPFVSERVSSTGLPLMDFGAYGKSGDVATLGPQSLLRLSKTVQAQEVFAVAEVSEGGSLLGDDTDIAFNGSLNYAFVYGESITNGGGFVRFNGYHRMPELVLNNTSWRVPRTTDAYSTTKANALQLTDVCFGDGNEKPVHYIASDRIRTAGTGGVRIGEVLIYSEKLTDDERKRITDYLMQKWFAKANRNDFDVANVADGAAIKVPAGSVARIGTLRVTGTSFTKKGAGTLVVGRVYPEDLTITVEGGDVQVEAKVAEGEPTSPVGTPEVWLDADFDAAKSFETSGDDVTAWCDRRGNGKKAQKLELSKITAYPTIDTTSLSGHTVLTFPENAAYTLPNGSGSREMFIAFRFDVSPKSGNCPLAEGYKTNRRMKIDNVYHYYLLAAPDVGNEILAGGSFSVDGKPVRPYEEVGSTFVRGQWHVLHVATPETVALSRLASDGARDFAGGVSYGEIVTYDVELTPEERRANIDYLMRKWQGNRHPEYAAPNARVSLALEGDATVGAELDAIYAKVTGEGTLTKTGSGHATVVDELTEAFETLTVRDGTLTVTKVVEPPDRSAFHFDAMDAKSFAEYYIDANGETNVSKWTDTRDNGTYAYNPGVLNPGDPLYVTNPILRHVEFPDGKTRPVLDFLTAHKRGKNPPTGAGFYISPSVGNKTIREAHYIFGNGQSHLRVFHGQYSSDFLRGTGSGNNKQLFRNGDQSSPVSLDIQNGYISVNNNPTNSTYVLRDGKFYLVSVAPLTPQDISSISIDRTNEVGGDRYGECLAFTECLEPKERAFLQAKLMHKWLGGPEAVWTNRVNEVVLGDSARLEIASGGSLLAPTLTGSGEIEATKVYGISALNVTVSGRDSVDGINIDGVAAFADEVVVNLVGDAAAKLRAGEYTILSAESLENVHLERWTVSPMLRNGCTFFRDGESIKLRVAAPGMLLLVR